MTDRPERSLLERDILLPAVLASLRKLDPRHMVAQPGHVRGRGRRRR